MGIQQRGKVCRLFRGAPLLAGIVFLSLITASAAAQARAVLHRTPVEYPPLAEKMRISGKVTLVVSIEPAGNVTEAKAVAGHALLRPAAEKAVLQWKFASAPKPEDTSIELNFKLRNEDTR